MNRQLRAVTGLCVAGGALGLLTAGRVWASQVVRTPAGDSFVTSRASVTGAAVAPAVAALSVVLLAGVLGVAGSRGRGRRVVGALLLATGLGLAAVSLSAGLSVGSARAALRANPAVAAADAAAPVRRVVAWPALATLAGLAGAAAGGGLLARGHTWSALPGRYERAAPAAVTRNPWEEFDAGGDPTA